MKDKVLVFIIGLLVGAVITASGFLIYQNANKNANQMPNGEQMQMMEKPDGEPPEKPSESENSENDSNRPEPPSKNNSLTNNKTN